MNLRSRQHGISSLGILSVMLIGAFALTCALKLIPVYMEAATVASSIERAIEDNEFSGMSNGQIKSKIGKFFDVNRVEAVSARDVKVTNNKGLVTIDANYEQRIPLLFNIDVVVKFEENTFTFKP